MSERPRGQAAGIVRAYHARSHHQPGRSAPGPGTLDWANQPDPFRVYDGAPRVELPLASEEAGVSWAMLHRPGAVSPRPLGLPTLGAFFELALGLTAWKAAGGERWALRANPSSGNLHPTEGYAILAEREGLPAGVYHYLSRDHVLERRFEPQPAAREAVARLLGSDTFLFGLASIHWREAWKYGMRAFRYCQHDAGHALAAARYAAGVLGWSLRLLVRPGDEDLAALLGLDRQEDHASIPAPDREQPEVLALVGHPQAVDERAARIEAALGPLVAASRQGQWRGRPNALSAEHLRWDAIDEVAEATRQPRLADGDAAEPGVAAVAGGTPSTAAAPAAGEREPAVRLIRQRRSAVEMDGETAIEAGVFFQMLARLLPQAGVPPWDAWPWRPRVTPVLFVHRVRGLAPGLYLLERAAHAQADLRTALRPAFEWSRPALCPSGLPLVLLEAGDARSVARFSSCQQAIASDSAFAVAMLAELEPLVSEQPWSYRRLHWEAGLLGQVLYLEAEATGVRGTGIGCFFDDVVHELLGLDDGRWRDIYHFTIGGAVEDRRLTTLAAYGQQVVLR